MLAAVSAAAWITHPWWLRQAGLMLVHVDEPENVDAIVVLAGDWSGERIMKAVDMVKRGIAPRVLVSGVTLHFGIPECKLAVDFAVRNGGSPEWFDCFVEAAHSTREEAEKIVPELKRRGVGSILVITNDAHTARARYVWRKQAPGMKVLVTASNDEFQRGVWWRDRESWKEFHNEVVKNLTSWGDL